MAGSGEKQGRYEDVGPVSLFAHGRGRAVLAQGTTIAVFRRGQRFHATADACPHMGASLSGGRLVGDQLECHWHHWRFDLGEGTCDQRSWACLAIYPVLVEQGRVLIGPCAKPPQPPARSEADDDEEWTVWDDDKHIKRR